MLQLYFNLKTRIILSSSKENAWVLDPFSGSATTGIAANLLNRKYLGTEQEKSYLELSVLRYKQIQDKQIRQSFLDKIF